VDLALKNLQRFSLDELVEAGGFFCDLHRAGLNDARIHKAVQWNSECRFGSYDTRMCQGLFVPLSARWALHRVFPPKRQDATFELGADRRRWLWIKQRTGQNFSHMA